MTSRRFRASSAAVLAAGILGAWTLDARAAQRAETSRVEESCVVQAGDLNGDGTGDRAIGVRGADGSRAAYIFFGPEPLPAIVDLRFADLVLRGTAAAPFDCDRTRSTVVTRTATAVTARKPARANPIDRPPSYVAIDLDPLMPAESAGFSSVASHLNDLGEVVGRFFTADGERAFLYADGIVRDLGTLGGHISDARGINDAGLVVGYSLTGETDGLGFVQKAFMSDGTLMQDLGLRWAAAHAVNNAGQIVGETRILPDAATTYAFIYERGAASELGTLPSLPGTDSSVALSINDAAQIVGASSTFVQGETTPAVSHVVEHAFLYDNGIMRDLGTLGRFCRILPGLGERCNDDSTATDVNNAGLIVGFSTAPADGQTHAFVSNGTAMADLGTLGGASSWAYSVNDSGQIVGTSLDAADQFAPFLVDRGVMYDLNALLVDPQGPLPFAAFAINNFGYIAANHHLLVPQYDALGAGAPALAFSAALGETLEFEYWVDRAGESVCTAARDSGPRLQVRVDPVNGAGRWMPVATLPACGSSADWQPIAVQVPPEAANGPAGVRMRLQGPGGRDTTVYLRHLTTR